ncbi:unnamed protein product [marine sediment metagenome]|uniref:Uncharacterized protein n=1 Tax=marine sediment metagenome TaxID=412755 RepID=X1MCW4_9ZZZZ
MTKKQLKEPQVIQTLDTDYKKDEKEEASDILQLLYLIKRAQRPYLGITKLQKLTFLTELEQQKKSIKGFNFLFYRWNYGAYSRDLQELCGMLLQFGLIKKPHKINKKGRDYIKKIFQNNKEKCRYN